jgi:aryl-alcohol dehydrogenase-like predicted oxidoreductase
MQTVRLGKTALVVSRIGFGGIPIQRLSEDEAVRVVQGCLDLGVTFLDTANGYTSSEERIGRAVRGRRQGVVLATKTQRRDSQGVRTHLELSLRRLGTEFIDLYQFHGVSDLAAYEAITDPSGPLATLEAAKREGLIGHIGMTSHSPDIAKRAVKSGLFETVMFPFNFISCEPADDLLPLAEKNDVGFIAMKPMAGGLLESASLAFRYLLQFPWAVPIVGVERVEEMEQAVAALRGPLELGPGDREQMKEVRARLGKSFCHRCDYCQPCSEGIAISMVMVTKSSLRRLPEGTMFEGWYAGAIAKAKECTDCGECETRCPYELPIRDILKQNIAAWEEASRARTR